jgi:hypothetical protein
MKLVLTDMEENCFNMYTLECYESKHRKCTMKWCTCECHKKKLITKSKKSKKYDKNKSETYYKDKLKEENK